MKTWKEIKDETLQLMFSYSNLGELDLSDVNKDYILQMPNAANFALIELANIRPILSVVRINQQPVHSLLEFLPGSDLGMSGEFEVTRDNAASYTFDVSGLVSIVVLNDGAVVARYDNIEQRGFTNYRGSVDSPGSVTIQFNGEDEYTIRNLAMYEESFTSDDLIPPYTASRAYNIRELGRKYMKIAPEKPVWHRGRDISPTVVRNRDVIFIDRELDGEIQIYYHAYPETITAATPDDYVMELEDEALELVPLYMASRLYMDDDSSIATMYFNMYDAKKTELIMADEFVAVNEWVTESGWV